MVKIIKCVGCVEMKEHEARKLCNKCYQKYRYKNIHKNLIFCKICNKEKIHHAKGLCRQCYKTIQNHKSGKHQPMNQNKNCSLYLGVIITEFVLSKVFKNIQRMPNGNKGFDFICEGGFKINSKSSVIRNQKYWSFKIKQNKIPDYFLCLAFDNREDLNPLYVWLIPSKVINDKINISISISTLNKWNEYKLDIDKIIDYCNDMRGDK